jgi:hypothetical protein
MKPKTDRISLTASRFSALVGIDRNELLKRLAEQKAEPTGRKNGGDEYDLRALFNAAIGGDVAEQRLRKIRAEADKLEHDLAVKRGQFVPVDEVKQLGVDVMTKVRTVILTSPLEHREQDEILRQLHELANHDWTKPGAE